MPDDKDKENYILFKLVGTTYGIKSDDVSQMEMVEHITPVPNAPDFVEGLVFLRGEVIPAINLRARFGFEKIEYDIKTRIIIVQKGERKVGLIVDNAREFVAIPGEVIKPPPETISGLSGQYLQGVATMGDRLILILNIEKVLNFTNIKTSV
ncbi:MAG TPA: chemotaxis protein CheW [Syntrophorhabdaceae bacterium]|nr:chemotaxis protein CheW [Syntrophorhabdaceae bacterium]HPU30164.1 chemotaxis protein CheW [Syntrophorhabdaceae bacterium]